MKRLFLLLISTTIVLSTTGQKVERNQNLRLSEVENYFQIGNSIKKNSGDYAEYRQAKSQPRSLNSQAIQDQKLDSIVTKNFYASLSESVNNVKFEYSFDQYGNTKSIMENEWDFNLSRWIPVAKIEFAFNTSNEPTLELKNYWDEISNEWIIYRKYEYSYDNDGNLLSKMRVDIDENSSQWVINWKIDLIYDAYFRLVFENSYEWDTLTSQFIQDWKLGYVYDSIGNLIFETSFEWLPETSQWRNEDKFVYTYNINNQDSTIVFYQRDYDGNDSLIYRWKNVISFNSNTHDKVEEISYWNKSLSYWEPSYKYENNYTANGKHEQEILSYWSNDGYWAPQHKDEFIYDNYGNLLLFNYLRPKDSIGTWQLNKKRDYQYNNNYSISEVLFPDLNWFPTEYYQNITTMPIDYVSFETSLGVLSKKFELIHYYSDINSDVLEKQNKTISIYPNPTSGQVIITMENGVEINELTIFNQRGQVLLHQKEIPSNINLSTLGQGIYILEFTSKNKIYRKKLIIK